jgi:PAS domain S-box-containing protein
VRAPALARGAPAPVLAVVASKSRLDKQMALDETNKPLETGGISGKKLLDESFKVEHEFSETLLDTVDAVILVLDQQGRFTRVNRYFQQLFGYETSDLEGKFAWDVLIRSEERDSVKEVFCPARSFRGKRQHKQIWLTSDGVELTIAWSITRLANPTENNGRFLISGIDVSARDKVEHMLEREHMLLQSLIDSIQDLIFYKDINSVYLGCNRAFEAFSGRKMKDYQGETDASFYPPDTAQGFLDTDQRVLATGQDAIYENWTTDPAGEPILLETRKTPYRGLDGKVLGVIGIGRDITRHRLAEEALLKANSEIEQLISSLSSILIGLTPELRVTMWNTMAQKILGIPASFTSGKYLGELSIQWEWNEIKKSIYRSEIDNRSIFMDPIRFKRGDGREGFLGINISPIHSQDKTISGYILLCADITERKLLESRLAQAQKLESIGSLAAGIAHEINTPIQYIGDNTLFLQSSFSDLLGLIDKLELAITAVEENRLLPEQIIDVRNTTKKVDLEYLRDEVPLAIGQSLEGIERVSEIVRAMKDFSHPGVKKKTSTDLNKAIENTLTVARNEWKYVSEVQTDLDPDLPMVLCHAGEINQVILNILVNAAQAIGDAIDKDSSQKGLISVSTRRDEDQVEIRISDTGKGVPEEIGNRIFEPFFTTKDVGKGTGQGLAIAYDVVAVKHKGNLTYENNSDGGATFIIRLPIQTDDENNA